MVKAVIFDCFGVLYPDTFWAMVNKFVVDWEEKDPARYHDIVRRVDAGLVEKEAFWDETAAACGIDRQTLDAEIKQLGTLDMDLLSYVAELRGRGLKTGVLSNVGRGFIEAMFKDLDIVDYFDDLVLSSEVGLTKPDREIFALSAGRLGVEPQECVFIDDRDKFCEGARAAGMQAILYKGLTRLRVQLEPLLG